MRGSPKTSLIKKPGPYSRSGTKGRTSLRVPVPALSPAQCPGFVPESPRHSSACPLNKMIPAGRRRWTCPAQQPQGGESKGGSVFCLMVTSLYDLGRVTSASEPQFPHLKGGLSSPHPLLLPCEPLHILWLPQGLLCSDVTSTRGSLPDPTLCHTLTSTISYCFHKAQAFPSEHFCL